MKNKIIFLRHAETQKDPSRNASFWHLSREGKKQAREVCQLDIMDTIDIIYTSQESKTSLTVAPLAQKLNKQIYSLSFFDEVKRGDKFLLKEEFEFEKEKQLSDLSYPAFDGESGLQALARFREGVDKVAEENPQRTILIVTHGTILNIYFAYLLDVYSQLVARWKNTPFCAYGVIKNGSVTKDIIK